MVECANDSHQRGNESSTFRQRIIIRNMTSFEWHLLAQYCQIDGVSESSSHRSLNKRHRLPADWLVSLASLNIDEARKRNCYSYNFGKKVLSTPKRFTLAVALLTHEGPIWFWISQAIEYLALGTEATSEMIAMNVIGSAPYCWEWKLKCQWLWSLSLRPTCLRCLWKAE